MSAAPASRRIAEIDVLRAIAVLAVVAYHLDRRLMPGGFAGVDVFFVVSGYVVTRSLCGHVDESLRSFLSGFYARRVRRILPALLVCLAVTSWFEVLFVPTSWLSSSNFDTARYALFGASNVLLNAQREAYFSPRIEFNPYAHTWSLGVEEQFYVVLPLLLYVAIVSGGRRGVRGAWAAVLAVGVLSFVASAYLSFDDPAGAYYSIVSRFWELGAGALLAIRHHASGAAPSSRPGRDRLRLAMAVVLLALAICGSDERHFPVPYALLAVGGSLLFIDRIREGDRLVLRGRAVDALRYVGTISYSIYLWHWPVFALFRWTAGLSTPSTALAALAATAALSIASYHLVEQPFQSTALRVRRSVTIAAGACAIVVATVAFQRLHDMAGRFSLSVTRDASAWYPDLRRSNVHATGCHTVAHAERFGDGKVTVIESRDCAFANGARRLFASGDSHTTAYLPMFERIATLQPVDIRIYDKPGCPVFGLEQPAAARPGCAEFVDAVLRDAADRAKPGDVLFLSSLRLQRLGEPWSTGAPTAPRAGVVITEASRDAATDEAIVALRRLASSGLDIVVEAPKPIFRAPAFRCSDWFNRPNPGCAGGLEIDAAFLKAYREPAMIRLARLRAAVPAVRIWDPFDTLCPGTTCRAVVDGVPLFFDGDHVSGAANERLAPAFVRAVLRSPPLADAGSSSPQPDR